jgi:hypothetical protein
VYGVNKVDVSENIPTITVLILKIDENEHISD